MQYVDGPLMNKKIQYINRWLTKLFTFADVAIPEVPLWKSTKFDCIYMENVKT